MDIEKGMKNLLILLCAYFLFLPIIRAQQPLSVTGTIKDPAGKALPFVTVRVGDSPLGTNSDEKGTYKLQLPAGNYTLTASLVGYVTATRTIDIRQNTIADFILKEDTITLGTVNIYGKSKVRKLKESVYSVNALDVKSVVNSVTNLSDLVNRTAGVRVRTEGGLGSDFDLSLNGMSGNSIRYFIDDVPLNIKGNEMSLVNLPVNTIDRIEIYKGVVPSHLGADAMGGAINIITRKHKKNFLDASYSISSFHTHIADLNALYVFRKTGIILKPTLGISYSKNDYKVKGVELWNEEQEKFLATDVKRFHDDYFSVFSQIEAGIENKRWADALYVSGSYNRVNKELQTGSIQTIVYGMAEREQNAWNVSARYNKRDFLIKDMQVNALLSQTWDRSVTTDTAYRKYKWDGTYITTSRNEITGRGRQIRHYIRPLTIARFNADYKQGDHHAFNFNYLMYRNGNRRYDDIDMDFEPSNDVMTKHIAGFTYSQSFFREKLANSFFIKDYINHVEIGQTDLPFITNSDEVPRKTTKNYIGYGAGIRYMFTTPFALKASYEHAVRLPLARELLGNGSTVYPNFALKPENSNNYNAGIYGTFRPSPEHYISYEANAFFRNVKDYIHAVVSEAEGTIQYDNVSNANVKGVEGEINYHYRNQVLFSANCSYQDSRNRDKYLSGGKPSVIYKNKIPNKPWLYGNAEITFNQPDILCKESRLRLTYFYQYVHWFFLTWEGYGQLNTKSKIPTQHQHSVVATYSWDSDRYNISLECNNLFDSRIYDNFMLQKPGRSFKCKFRIFIH